MLWIVRSTEFPRPSAGCSWPALPAGLGVSGFWVGRLLDQSRQIGTAAADDPAKQNRVAPRGDCARRQWRSCCSAIRPASSRRRCESLQRRAFPHSPLSTRLRRRGNNSFEPVLWSAMGLLGMVSGSAVRLHRCVEFRPAVWRLLCREAFHRVMVPSPSFSVASAMPTGGTGKRSGP
jgi:hypothetical protein